MCQIGPNTPKFIIVSADYHNITRLFPLTILVSAWLKLDDIDINKGNIAINKLIAHPYYISVKMCMHVDTNLNYYHYQFMQR